MHFSAGFEYLLPNLIFLLSSIVDVLILLIILPYESEVYHCIFEYIAVKRIHTNTFL